MKIDFSDLGLEETETPTASEPSEPLEDEDEGETPSPTTAAPQKPRLADTIDRSVPLQERIDREIADLKFSTGFMASYELASALQLAELVKEELLVGDEAEHFCKMWDGNKWTFADLWKAVQEEARKQSGGQSFGVRDGVVLGWVRHIVIDTKNEPKPAATTAKPKKQAKPTEPKPQPKPQHEQMHINFADIFGGD